MSKNQVLVQDKKQLTAGERFSNKIIAEFTSGVGEVALTDFQKRLGQNYFISLDTTLKTAEANRQKKSEKNRDAVPVTWENVDMNQLARNVVTYARIGLDPAQKNHIHAMPFKNNSTKKYDIVFIEGYRGLEIKAQKYGLDVPDAVTVEVVYSNDKFRPIKKDRNNKVESYEFEVTNPFDRGEIVGGFYYHIFNDNPSKNKLVIMTIKDVEKRKPRYASVEFWGGEKDVWENGNKTGKKEKIEGWFEEMVYKTIYRAAYNDITIDSQKIDDAYLRLKQLENQAVETRVQTEIDANANQEFIDIDPEEVSEVVDAEVIDETQKKENSTSEQISIDEGPGY